MSSRLLALLLILLQGVAVLPARMSVCLGPTGEFCCIDGGAGRCCSDVKSAKTAENPRSCCGGHHAACEEALPAADAFSPNFAPIAPEHQHVEFSLFQGETLRASREQWSVDGGDASLAGLPMMAVVTMEGTPFSALTEARYRERAARSISFSLFARASSVLRC